MTFRLLIASGISVVVLASSPACRADVDAQVRAQGMFERTLPVAGPLRLDIRTGSGNVRVQRGPADSIHIVARLSGGRSWFNGDAEERIRRIEAAPPITQTGNTIRIGPLQDDRLYRNISISYDVTVPMETSVQSRTGSGSQTISDLSGPVDASTGSGGIAIRAIRTDVRASTGSGSIQIEDVGIFFGRTGSGSITAAAVRGAIDASTGSGRIDVAQTGEGDVDVETGSGGIDVSGARRGLRARAGSGTIEIDGRPAGGWSVETGSGGIRIDVPEDSAFELNVRAGSGSINTTHPVSQVGTVSRNRLRGTVRGGGSLVDLSTGSGAIQID
jgi:DUF4097 and DUF4098 domain-containing protein YvlB